MIIIESQEGFICGGFSPVDWDSSQYINFHNDAFIFTLSNPHSIPPTRYLKEGNLAIQNRPDTDNTLLAFGADIIVTANTAIFINFPFCYLDTTNKGPLTFTGTISSFIKQFFVYEVKPC